MVDTESKLQSWLWPYLSMTLGKSFTLSGSQFPKLLHGIPLTSLGCCEDKRRIRGKCSGQ